MASHSTTSLFSVSRCFSVSLSWPVVFACVLLIAGCNSQTRNFDRRISFSYSVGTMPNVSSQVTALRNQQIWVGRLAGITPGFWPPCKFTSDPTDAPDININGVPGQQGGNVQLLDSTPSNTETGNASTCGHFSLINISIGSANEVLTLTFSHSGSATFMVDGESFTTDLGGYFDASLDQFDPNTNYKAGHFNFLAIGNQNRVLLVWGGFSGS